MGWLVLLLLLVLASAALWLMRVRGPMLQACGAALLLGAAGYALQGRPGLPGAPADTELEHRIRSARRGTSRILRQFLGGETWLTMSEALERDGNTEDAVGILQNAVRRYPRPGTVDWPRQCAGRPRARHHAAGRARLQARGRACARASGGALLLRACARPLWRHAKARCGFGDEFSPRHRLTRAGGRWLTAALMRWAASRGRRSPRPRRPARTADRALPPPPGAGSCRPRR